MKNLTAFSLLMFIVLLNNAQNQVNNLINRATNYKYPFADKIVLFDSTIVDVQETGLSYVNNHILYKVLTYNGAKELSQIKFDYDPLSAFVEIKKAIIYRANGEKEVIDINKVYDYPAPARMIYWGARQKMINVGKLRPGDAIEVFMFRKGFTYALLYNENDDDKYIPPMKGHFYDIVNFWADYPILTKYYETNIPNSKFVQYKFYNANPDSLIIKDENKTKYAFTLKNIMPIEKEHNMVALSDIAPKLLISTSPDWEAKSTWFYGVNEDYGSFESTPEIDKKVSEILIDAKDELDSISKLTHWVADNMRYSGISMGEGEGYTLHNGEMNFRDRCGVCKDKAGMLITFLRAAGFESYPAMTMAGSKIDNIPADQFNHSVTVVKLSNGKYKMLDPTWVPFLRELWSSREQQQNYLMGLPEGADLMETPISPPENHFLRINAKSELLADGTLKGNFTLEAEGQSDAAIRSIFTRSFKANWNNNIEAELLKIFPLLKIDEVTYPDDPYNYSDNIVITVQFTIPDFAIVTDEEMIFTPFVAMNIFKRAQAHLYFNTSEQNKQYPFKDACSRLVELSETITLPKSVEEIYLPEEELVESSSATFSGSYNLAEKSLSFTEKATYNKRVYQPDEWEAVKNAVDAQNKFANEKVILKVKN